MSREPIPFLVAVLEAKGRLDISTSGLFGADADAAKAVVRAITEKDNWHGRGRVKKSCRQSCQSNTLAAIGGYANSQY